VKDAPRSVGGSRALLRSVETFTERRPSSRAALDRGGPDAPPKGHRPLGEAKNAARTRRDRPKSGDRAERPLRDQRESQGRRKGLGGDSCDVRRTRGDRSVANSKEVRLSATHAAS